MNSSQLKVLLIEDNHDDAALIQAFLAAAPAARFQLVVLSRCREGLSYLEQKGPGVDLILLDLGLPDSQGLDTFQRIYSQVPHIPILVLTGLDDETVAMTAVRQGAQDYLVKGHIDGFLLPRAILHAIERHRFQRESLEKEKGKTAKVIGFLGAKGGVGTTTVALNVAAALAQQKKDVIAVEMKAGYGSFALLMGANPAVNLTGLLKGEADFINLKKLHEHLYGAIPGLRLLFGPQKAEELRPFDTGQALAIVKGLAAMADYMILDLPGWGSEALRELLLNCRQIVLVVERELTAVLSGKVTMEIIKLWGINPSLVGLVVVTRMVFPVSLSNEEIKSRVGCDILGLVPYSLEACLTAQKAGKPIVLADPGNIAADSLIRIARQLAQEAPAKMAV